VGLDEKTYQHFGTFKFSRKIDARLIDNLVAMGARHIYFDRTYSDVSTPADDQAMIDALRRSEGKVSLGTMAAIGSKNSVTGMTTAITPWPGFRKFSQVALLNGSIKPFSLSVEFPYSSRVSGQIVTSASAQIAGRSGKPDVYYRPDWSIQMRTIPPSASPMWPRAALPPIRFAARTCLSDGLRHDSPTCMVWPVRAGIRASISTRWVPRPCVRAIRKIGAGSLPSPLPRPSPSCCCVVASA
jgi:hypothetical protein